ncbi:hypothetical protein EMIHUDRAFT_209366 [Emiliania huxleyi CCMP1516]|uniref:Protein kinase domain-containing protein n=2 Tax=Emiliania huxleyi TaxID=2903 RepID=A0A0D3J5K3_EMIH1|nr:hypothetical protein EMIHUDRAFT_209366 [Emiliania huxleyi CCMP1516]EOD18788.1 hypothetical protein EMIHUDRAFT_209366 [Emiliania huxleyi CCMP1516]|eukprot:XP_005771217.1 hypothetical protein EMIHUDRAFT_209366 [Emiliania huxleyi CCMP1516]
MVVASSDGHSGAASATWEHVHRHFAVAALLSPETPHARKVGEGGFGRVYRCDALPSLPRVASGFAVKRALVGVGAQGLAELQSEVRTLSAACHRSLLPLLSVCLAPARACLVYPLCRGGSLEDRLYRAPAAIFVFSGEDIQL